MDYVDQLVCRGCKIVLAIMALILGSVCIIGMTLNLGMLINPRLTSVIVNRFESFLIRNEDINFKILVWANLTGIGVGMLLLIYAGLRRLYAHWYGA